MIVFNGHCPGRSILIWFLQLTQIRTFGKNQLLSRPQLIFADENHHTSLEVYLK